MSESNVVQNHDAPERLMLKTVKCQVGPILIPQESDFFWSLLIPPH